MIFVKIWENWVLTDFICLCVPKIILFFLFISLSVGLILIKFGRCLKVESNWLYRNFMIICLVMNAIYVLTSYFFKLGTWLNLNLRINFYHSPGMIVWKFHKHLSIFLFIVLCWNPWNLLARLILGYCFITYLRTGTIMRLTMRFWFKCPDCDTCDSPLDS